MTETTKIKIIRIPGATVELEVEIGKTLESILIEANISIDFSKQALMVGSNKVQESEVNNIKNIEGVIIISTGAKGHAPTPKIKSVIKYLKSRGYIENGGKGDHRKFSNQKGEVIVLNPDNRDQKHLDLGSAKSLAKALGLNLTTLYAEFN